MRFLTASLLFPFWLLELRVLTTRMSLLFFPFFFPFDSVRSMFSKLHILSRWCRPFSSTSFENSIHPHDPQVVANCVVVFNEIMADAGGMGTNGAIIHHLLGRLEDSTSGVYAIFWFSFLGEGKRSYGRGCSLGFCCVFFVFPSKLAGHDGGYRQRCMLGN